MAGNINAYRILKNFLSNDMDLIFTDLNTSNTQIDLKKLTTKPTCVIIGPMSDMDVSVD